MKHKTVVYSILESNWFWTTALCFSKINRWGIAREACVGWGISPSAKHRSESVARSTPTRAQRGTRPKN